MTTSFEKDNNITATYQEAISFYKSLADQHREVQISEFGLTDSGMPLHEVIISTSGEFNPQKLKESDKAILFINNAIHPGEPCGVDASMMLARNYMQSDSLKSLLENVVVVIVPLYNIGGALNRNSTTRANQLGPESYGFRGNAKNLDLNRDFIKCDSENAKSFNLLFNKWNPEVMIDNHTSNGADYQYTMTLIPSQKDKLAPEVSSYMVNELLPDLYVNMEEAGWEMTPYVYARNTPDQGIYGFLDLARYSSGYAAVHNTISFMPETHMLKPYVARVESTYAFMDCMIRKMASDYEKIVANKRSSASAQRASSKMALNWELDLDKIDTFVFKGYEAKYKPSEISGQPRLYYDHDSPYEKEISFYNSYKVTVERTVPESYIIPQAYSKVIDRLSWNGVHLERLEKDSTIEVEMYYIEDYKSSKTPYEGHYLHRSVKLNPTILHWKFFKGDYRVRTDQDKIRYILETLEPDAPDSFFAWNFFDGILMQKEYFSSYVFEDLAVEIINNNPKLKSRLDAKKASDPEFNEDSYAQLKFIYENSEHFEPTYKLYPIGRTL